MPLFRHLTSWYFSKNAFPYWCVLLADSIIIVVSGMLAQYVVQGGAGLAASFWYYVRLFAFMLPCYWIGMKMFHTYSGVLRYSSIDDMKRVAYSQALGTFCVMFIHYFLPVSSALAGLRLMTVFVLLILSTLGMWGLRVAMQTLYQVLMSDKGDTKVFIYGAKEGAVALANMLNANPDMHMKVVGFVSIDGSLEDKYLMGVKVRRDGPNLITHIQEENAKTIVISPLQTERFRESEDLQKRLIAAGIKILMMPDVEDWDSAKGVQREQLKEVQIEDLLPRDKITVDLDKIGEMLKGKSVMVTGAAGSIGSEMARQLAKFRPARLILIDQAETPMHDVRLYMAKKHPDLECHTIVCSIIKPKRMEALFAEFKPQYVFHAAAYKHVPMMEDNPSEAVINNIYGTRVIADLAVKYGTKKFVMISTDKAVNPTNVMGCSKRISEIYCQALNNAIASGKSPFPLGEGRGEATQFVTTRFGNVLGSNGSVIPLFRKQIQEGGPLTVTHPDIIRFFMLIPEACQLVLEAGTMGKGGEIFVFDMGKPVRIADLAQRMIDLSGAKDVKIKFTGLRDGEKLYEEVLNDAEQTVPTVHPKIKVAKVREYAYADALKNEVELYDVAMTFDDMAIVKKMKEIVPEYKSQHSKYEVLDK